MNFKNFFLKKAAAAAAAPRRDSEEKKTAAAAPLWTSLLRPYSDTPCDTFILQSILHIGLQHVKFSLNILDCTPSLQEY
jgi:hypothetical protein